MTDRFDLEQQIMKCWNITEEIQLLNENVLEKFQVELICLAGFMRLLTGWFIEQWPQKIINIHPALLPKYGGKGMYGHFVHDAVFQNKESQSRPLSRVNSFIRRKRAAVG